MEFNKISAVFSVGTAFMRSGDSSPCIRMRTGRKCVETVHCDESPDAIMLFNKLTWISIAGTSPRERVIHIQIY